MKNKEFGVKSVIRFFANLPYITAIPKGIAP